MRDYYQILGIAPAAEEIVIRAAWKALAQRYHPDRYSGEAAEAHARMAEINEAYEVLSNPVRRNAYDQARANGRPQPPDAYAGQVLDEPDSFEKSWMLAVGSRPNFGNNPEILTFARQLMFEGNMEAAKELNAAINELSSEVPASWIINRICEDFNIETKEMWQRRMRREAKARENELWEKVRKKARREEARKAAESAAPEPEPITPSRTEVRRKLWKDSFLGATIVVLIFAGIMIWLFLW